jgi:hypothetical protein
MVLITVRMLMPPGICACKWTSPAARLLLALAQSERQIPTPSESDDDDHDAGCPASPLAVGMGVKPPCEPLLPPALALDPPSLESTPTPLSIATETPVSFRFDSSHSPLYVTFCALLV